MFYPSATSIIHTSSTTSLGTQDANLDTILQTTLSPHMSPLVTNQVPPIDIAPSATEYIATHVP